MADKVMTLAEQMLDGLGYQQQPKDELACLFDTTAKHEQEIQDRNRDLGYTLAAEKK